MLNSIYHPKYPVRVVDNTEYEKMLKNGWFKHPKEAEAEKTRLENELMKKTPSEKIK